MTAQSRCLKVFASIALVVMTCAGLASCGGGGGGSSPDVMTIAPRPPPQGATDLVVVSPSVTDSNPQAGGEFMLPVTVRNQGGGESAATTLRYYLSTDATITTSDTAVGTVEVVTLVPLGGSLPTIRLTAPSTPGTYYYGACVDAVAGESETTNNCSASVQVNVSEPQPGQGDPQTPQGRPDLAPLGVFLASGALDGSPRRSFTLGSRVRNNGDAKSAATELRFYRSWKRTIEATDNTFEDLVPVGPIAASGTSGALLLSLRAPSTPGTHYYGACVDAVAGESDTSNNCTPSLTITVEKPRPDLIVLGPYLSELEEDRTYLLIVTVHNKGAGRSAATTVRYKRSADATITTSDTTVGTVEVVTLVPLGGSLPTIRLTAPSTPGTYYYGACLDAVPRESDTTNNCSTSSEILVVN